MANRKYSRDLDRELDTPIPWVSALVIALMALVMFVGVAHGDEPTIKDVSAMREKLELGRQYLITEFAEATSLGTVTQEQATKTAQEIIQIDLAILQSYLTEYNVKEVE